MNDVYKALAEHLDTLPQRFPTNTGTGLELKVLQHIFSPEEAEMAIQLQPMPELPADIANRIGKDAEETEALLMEMSKKGQILRLGKPGEHKYMAAPFMVGIMEWQLNRFTKEMVEDLEAFQPYLMEQTWMKGKTRELRTIPIDKTVTDTSEVMPYESAEAIIKSAKYISVAECMCRKISKVKGEPCDRPLEVCLQFCESRCQMDAITVEDYSRVDLDRCIGCGLCVTTCDFDAIMLHKKDENHQWVPQPDYMTAVMDIYKERREG